MPEVRYVISIKALEDVMHRPTEEWRYAGIDGDSYGSGYPCWCYEFYSCKKFTTIEAAEEWFNHNREYLFGRYYNDTKFDKSTLGIRQIVFKKVKSLNL